MKCTHPGKCDEPAIIAFDLPNGKHEACCIRHAATWLERDALLLVALFGSVTFRAVMGRHKPKRGKL